MAEKAKTAKKTTKKTTTKKTTVKNTAAKKPAAVKATKAVKETKTVKAEAPKTEKKAKKSHKGLIIGIIFAVLAIALAGCIAVYVYLSMNLTYLVGNYTLTGMWQNGEDQSASIQLLEGFGLSATMELKDDKTGTMHLFGTDSELTYDKDKMVINDKDVPFTYKDGQITFSENDASLTFTKDSDK